MLSFELLKAIPATDFSYRKNNLPSITALIMGLKMALPIKAETAPAITFSQALLKSTAQSKIPAITNVIFTTLPSSDT